MRLSTRTVSTVAAFASAALVLAACQSAPSGSSGNDTGATDDGTTISMWTRAPTAAFTQALVDAYNGSHRNKVQLTVIPADSYQQKVGTAAGARQLPDVLAADVVYAPNYASNGVFLDLTARVDELPFKDDLAPAHVKAATRDGRIYGVPHDIDLSAVFYNKVLYTRAGLDPEKPPTTLDQLYEHARRIDAIGGDVQGYFFGGACPGCILFTTWPMIWASGGTVLNDEGTASTIDNAQAEGVYALYRRMFQEGLVPQSAKNENGPTWTQEFLEGRIGIQPMGSTALQTIVEGPDLQVGVAPIPGLTGGSSSFVGGDVLGIGANSQRAAQAWDFISWTLSEQAQLEVVAKNKNITARGDLADNDHTRQDPRLRTFTTLAGEGETPVSVNFGRTFNDPNGPWTAAAIEAIFGTGPVGEVLGRQSGVITESLASGG